MKDLRNRIASVKATRKITKAMQMVAAAKLRRAQEAATAARPYAERMDARARQPQRAASPTRPGASPLLVGTGKDQVHLLVVMTAERGLCGGFNSNIARLARARRRRACARPARRSRSCAVGRKGYDALRRDCGRSIVDRVDLKGVKQLGFANAEAIADKVLALFEAGEFDVAHAVLLRVQVGDRAEADGAAADPGASCRRRRQRAAPERRPVYEYEPSEEEILGALLPRNIATQIFRGAAGERRLRAGRAHVAPWTTPRATPAT